MNSVSGLEFFVGLGGLVATLTGLLLAAASIGFRRVLGAFVTFIGVGILVFGMIGVLSPSNGYNLLPFLAEGAIVTIVGLLIYGAKKKTHSSNK